MFLEKIKKKIMSKIKYPCGCEFECNSIDSDIEITKEDIFDLPKGIDVDVYNINENCKDTWKMICDGYVKGVFQVEQQLGQTYAQKLHPSNIDELCLLISIIRPGTLNSTVKIEKENEDGEIKIEEKSMSNFCCDVKQGVERPSYICKELEEILGKTYSVLVYQESSMLIASKIAGFSLEKSDSLRKGISKKRADLIAELETEFIEGCKKEKIVTEEQARELFGWIRNSQKYAFNKCLSPTSIVETKNGEFKILEEVKVGEEIATIDNKYTKILNKYDNGEKKIYRITLENDKHIDCTIDHKFMCTDNKKYSVEEIIKNNLKILCNELGAAKIKKIEYLGIQPTMDIEVNHPLNIFYANGIATSNSHGASYAQLAYITAYLKTHFPLQFYCAWLRGAHNKQKTQDEIHDLINDAKIHDIKICTPTLLHQETLPYIKEKMVYMGLGDIKKMGDSSIESLKSAINKAVEDTGKNINEWNWTTYLFSLSVLLSKTVNESLICCGALDFLHKGRNFMLYELGALEQLTEKEKDFLSKNYSDESSLVDNLRKYANIKKAGGMCYSRPRVEKIQNIIKTLENPPHDLSDSADFIAKKEQEYLGAGINASIVNACEDSSHANNACIDVIKKRCGKNISLAVELVRVNNYKTKRGKNPGQIMAFISGEDDTAKIDNIIAFPDVLEKYKELLFEGNTVLISGFYSNNDSVIVKEVKQI